MCDQREFHFQSVQPVKALPPVVETVNEEEPEEYLDQTPKQQNESWFPRPTYNVSASGTYESRTDLDLHVDTTVLGKHCMVVFDTNRTMQMYHHFCQNLERLRKSEFLRGPLHMITQMEKRSSLF